MQIQTTDGKAAEISHEEAHIIAERVMNEPHEYLSRALDNIERMTGKRPANEDELKDLMFRKLNLGNFQQTNLLYEMIEAIIGMFAVKSSI